MSQAKKPAQQQVRKSSEEGATPKEPKQSPKRSSKRSSKEHEQERPNEQQPNEKSLFGQSIFLQKGRQSQTPIRVEAMKTGIKQAQLSFKQSAADTQQTTTSTPGSAQLHPKTGIK